MSMVGILFFNCKCVKWKRFLVNWLLPCSILMCSTRRQRGVFLIHCCLQVMEIATEVHKPWWLLTWCPLLLLAEEVPRGGIRFDGVSDQDYSESDEDEDDDFATKFIRWKASYDYVKNSIGSCGLYSLLSVITYNIDLQEAAGRLKLRTDKGLLVTQGRDLQINLSHPFLRHQFSLPPMLTFPKHGLMSTFRFAASMIERLDLNYNDSVETQSCTVTEVNNLGNEAIFVGGASSLSVPSSEIVKPNSIYFTDTIGKPIFVEEVATIWAFLILSREPLNLIFKGNPSTGGAN